MGETGDWKKERVEGRWGDLRISGQTPPRASAGQPYRSLALLGPKVLAPTTAPAIWFQVLVYTMVVPTWFWAPRRQTVNLSCFVSWGPGSVPGTLLEVLVRLLFGRLLPAASHLHEGAPQAHCASSRKGTKEGRAHMCPLQRGPGSCTFHFHFDPIGQKFVIWPHRADRLLGNLVLF